MCPLSCDLVFGITVLEDMPLDEAEMAARLRVTLDHLANGAGLPAAPHFDAAGRYALPSAR